MSSRAEWITRAKEIGDRLSRKIGPISRRPAAGAERSSDWYDRAFSGSLTYQAPYQDAPYYVLWSVIVDRVRREGSKRVLDIGCGTGQLAALLFDQGIEEYIGLDFSATAIELARRAAPRGRFLVGDAQQSAVYEEVEFDVLICTEVLEHIEADLVVVSRFPRGSRCIFSVPNFSSAGHVRFFSGVNEVRERYGPYFSELDVVALRTPNSPTSQFFLADGRRNHVVHEP